jgi:hypothetical protein
MTSSAVEVGSEKETVACDVICGGTQVADSTDYSAREAADADRVLDSIHDDLLACYKARIRVAPQGTRLPHG